MLLVGYGQENGVDYWLIRNSWSSYWGDQGYVKIAQTPNDCGVSTSPTYAVIKSPPEPPVWPKAYTAEGTIKLPYIPITEPFVAYVDKSDSDGGKSRIDYYDGVMKTIQSDGKDNNFYQDTFLIYYKFCVICRGRIWHAVEDCL